MNKEQVQMSDTMSASDLIHQNLLRYSKSMIVAAFPNLVDGLKPVHRRILVALHKLPGDVSGQEVIASTMRTHPHGDGSIYNTAARLGQTFEYNPTLLSFDCSIGTYYAPNPAAPRYTKGGLSDFAKDIFFKGIDLKAIPKMMNEAQDGYEVIYLIPAVPTSLLYANNTIGYGESCYTNPLNLADVCDIVVAFCRHKKNNPLKDFDCSAHAEKFIPDFPIQGTLTNYDELLGAYKAGDFNKKVRLDGAVVLTHDSIEIKVLPYGVPFEKLTSRIEALVLSAYTQRLLFSLRRDLD